MCIDRYAACAYACVEKAPKLLALPPERIPGRKEAGKRIGNPLVLYAAGYVLLVAGSTLLGWVADIRVLLDWLNTGITQKANNAIAALLCASAMLVLDRRPDRGALARVLAGSAATIGGLTLLQHLTGVDLGIDTLLFDEPAGARATASPGRMGPIASAAYLLIGVGLLLSRGGARARQITYRLGVLTFVINGIPLLGYLYGADFFYAIPKITGIAFQTTTVLMALSIGLAGLVSEQGIFAVLRRGEPGNMLLRRMMIPLIVLPVLLGWLRLKGEQLDLYDTAFGTATFTFLIILLLSALAATSARRVGDAAFALTEQRERLRTTLASIGDAVITTDIRGRVTMMNSVAESYTGWNSSEAIGQPLAAVFDIVDEETRKELDNPAMRALRETRTVGLANHTILRCKDGTERPIDDSAAPIRLPDGEVIGCVLIFRDVTERRKTERTLRDADRRKDEFLATLGHELRNPLAPVATGLHILRLAGDDRSVRKRVVETMERQIKHVVRLVDDLLEVSRITSGAIQLRKETIELSAVVHSALEMATSVESAGVHLNVSVPNEPVPLAVDPVRIAQVIANLLNNAAKYTDKGGEIWLAARREANMAVISVRDTGIGIPAEMLPRVFDLFTRIDNARGRAQEGTGIGLALVKSLVELHGGQVEARSEGEGRGSEFVVRLPLAATGSSQRAASALPEVLPGLARRRILIVDDNHDAADSLAMLLRLEGAEVQVAYGGASALQIMRQFRPQVVLLDIDMPDTNGYMVASRVRADPEFRGVALIALTGWGQKEDRQRSKAAGFDAHLVKPADVPALVRLLYRLGVRDGGS